MATVTALQVLSLVSLAVGILFAKRHRVDRHHLFVASGIGLAAVAAVLLWTGGSALDFRGALVVGVAFYLLATALSGWMFYTKRVPRVVHRSLGGLAVLLLGLSVVAAVL